MSKPKDPESAEEISKRLDSMRPDGTFDRPLEAQDVTNVLEFALERVRVAAESTTAALESATARLLQETEATRELARSLTNPPKSG